MRREVQDPAACSLPPIVKGHWLLKSSRDLANDVLGFIRGNIEIYGNIYYVKTLGQHVCVISDPALIQYVLQENNRNYTKSFGYQILKLFLGLGLLTSEGDFWRKQRRLAQPAFHKAKLQSITATMALAANDLAKNWEMLADRGQAVNITHHMNEVTLDIVARALFGADVGSHIDQVRESINTANEFAMKRIFQFIRLPVWIPTPANLAFTGAAKWLDNLIYGIIEQRREKGNDDKLDLLSMLMDAVDEETGESKPCLGR